MIAVESKITRQMKTKILLIGITFLFPVASALSDNTQKPVAVAAEGGKADWVTVKATRLPNNPIIKPEMFKDAKDGHDINGPTLIRVPGWVAKPLGKYYLYFANHRGTYIRLAYADSLNGPWKIHEGGVLALDQLPVKMDHIASPELMVDEKAHRILLYYHGTVRDSNMPPNPGKWNGQLTFVATSEDGLAFKPRLDVMSAFYLRVFSYGGKTYGICKDGNTGAQLCRTGDPLSPFEQGPQVLPKCRHVALLPKGDTLWVFFSQSGGCPESILVTRFNLKEDWTKWGENAPSPILVLKPEPPWEGTGYNLKPSADGAAVRVQELRDPFVFEDEGKFFLLYSVAGEMGIAIAELEFSPKEKGPPLGR